jgi:hypothetical protein
VLRRLGHLFFWLRYPGSIAYGGKVATQETSPEECLIQQRQSVSVPLERLATHISLEAYIKLMDFSGHAGDVPGIIEHVMFGLKREDLIDFSRSPPIDPRGLGFLPSPLGSELFLRAHGLHFGTSSDILDPDLTLEIKVANHLVITPEDVSISI